MADNEVPTPPDSSSLPDLKPVEASTHALSESPALELIPSDAPVEASDETPPAPERPNEISALDKDIVITVFAHSIDPVTPSKTSVSSPEKTAKKSSAAAFASKPQPSKPAAIPKKPEPVNSKVGKSVLQTAKQPIPVASKASTPRPMVPGLTSSKSAVTVVPATQRALLYSSATKATVEGMEITLDPVGIFAADGSELKPFKVIFTPFNKVLVILTTAEEVTAENSAPIGASRTVEPPIPGGHEPQFRPSDARSSPFGTEVMLLPTGVFSSDGTAVPVIRVVLTAAQKVLVDFPTAEDAEIKVPASKLTVTKPKLTPSQLKCKWKSPEMRLPQGAVSSDSRFLLPVKPATVVPSVDDGPPASFGMIKSKWKIRNRWNEVNISRENYQFMVILSSKISQYNRFKDQQHYMVMKKAMAHKLKNSKLLKRSRQVRLGARVLPKAHYVVRFNGLQGPDNITRSEISPSQWKGRA
ncbi:hypothetical protein BV898_11856 [Hypsibius exemplaris]|uniref:Uncharacterized protein n=1 Tax=Hypsibius exemplaris TaxID=2072580 RepID=A0A1W0WFI3_HYPEX|nr:hypothetical protein BV898_11856 [Hypsibius exemplaris]